MSARSTPVKSKPSSPARSARGTPTKSPSNASTFNAGSRPSSAIKASSEGSWNLEGSNGKDINLETNVVNKAFQINKQLYGNDLDVQEEAREVEKRTAERLEMECAKVDAFRTKTNARAEANRKKRPNAKSSESGSRPGSVTNACSALTRPSSAPTSSETGMSRRLSIEAKKAADKALLVKPVKKLRRRSKKVSDSLRSSKAESELAASVAKASNERAAELARSRAASRARAAAEKEILAKALAAAQTLNALRERTRTVRTPLDKPLARHMAEKTTAPRPVKSALDIETTSIVQLSGLAGPDGTKLVGVASNMSRAFEALSAVTPHMIKEASSFVRPPAALLAVMEAVCVLVGEEPGWVVAKNLLKRRDFVPALALSSHENIPFARIRKFRSRGYLKNPLLDVDRLRTSSPLWAALLMWVLAIDAAAPAGGTPSQAGSTFEQSISLVNSSASLVDEDDTPLASTGAFTRSLMQKQGYREAPAGPTSPPRSGHSSLPTAIPVSPKSDLARSHSMGATLSPKSPQQQVGPDEDMNVFMERMKAVLLH